ncbi:ThuA domain-containing protein [Microbacterium sp. GCS4]|uniref:ThuA domain-containing protein n=1 Tax=Microbacterium sp. GCS4 TaxID=1692239 RepID=UPI000680D910|nr:ThuA domain-containing protein [Microbacterium sp. GCS4]KNY05288.1 hypothetical protein AKH00_13050 [Microbacterium sp. GCS4]
MPDALILTGSGRYSDPWHPYDETSLLLAGLAMDAGFEPRIETDVDAALRDLDADVRLLVVNAGDPEGPDAEGGRSDAPPRPSDLAAGDAALRSALERGIGVLVMHSGAASLRDYPSFGTALGGRWVRGESWHPEFGDACVHVVLEHPLAAGLADFDVQDERYTDLRMDAEVQRLAEHEEGGVRHPLVWTRQLGTSRLVYDGLGHDARSYASAGHRELLRRVLAWLGEPGR